MLKISHVVNPVRAAEESDLCTAQPITFAAMRDAAAFTAPDIDLDFISVQYKEDMEIVPGFMTMTRNLDRSSLDIQGIDTKRKLPMLEDIFSRVLEASDADYIVFSNVDVAPMPFFYNFVGQCIHAGMDSLIINRTTIDESYTDESELAFMYADKGKKHLGYDCFVIKRNNIERFHLDTAFLGTRLTDRILAANSIFLSNRFKLYEDHHLTFHIGDQKIWKRLFDGEVRLYMARALQRTINRFKEIESISGDRNKAFLLKEFELEANCELGTDVTSSYSRWSASHTKRLKEMVSHYSSGNYEQLGRVRLPPKGWRWGRLLDLSPRRVLNAASRRLKL